MHKRLWYESPANIWEEAMPIGNGRIGGMVFSGTVNDKIQINEDTLWSGHPGRNTGSHSVEEVKEIRKLIKEKKYKEAYEKTAESMFGVCSECYLSYGNIYVDILNRKVRYGGEGEDNCAVKDYKRTLD